MKNILCTVFLFISYIKDDWDIDVKLYDEDFRTAATCFTDKKDKVY